VTSISFYPNVDNRKVVEELQIYRLVKFHDFILNGLRDMFFLSSLSCSEEIFGRTRYKCILETLEALWDFKKHNRLVVLSHIFPNW